MCFLLERFRIKDRQASKHQVRCNWVFNDRENWTSFETPVNCQQWVPVLLSMLIKNSYNRAHPSTCWSVQRSSSHCASSTVDFLNRALIEVVRSDHKPVTRADSTNLQGKFLMQLKYVYEPSSYTASVAQHNYLDNMSICPICNCPY